MEPSRTYYITTPIYYVNGKPHIGSALTTVCCDVLARYQRMRGRRTWLLTGTDEQATKVKEAAEAAGVPVQAFVDGLSAEFRSAWEGLNVAFDDFIRTTEPRHIRVVQEVFRRLRDTGDIYLGTYEGWYCVSDETYFRDSDVGPDHVCPNPECGKPLRRVQEESYFFRLSAYGDRLLEYIEAHPQFLQPEFRRNEVIGFIKQGLRDMSITRTNDGWGIPVPDDPSKVIYVWFDALINYLAATGWPDDQARFGELWPAEVHLMAKEIYVRFHATLWPAMLMGLGLPLPETVYAHGWWVDASGRKEGKRTGGLPHPLALARDLTERCGVDEKVAVDAVRYLLLSEMTFHGDTEFSAESFDGRYNADLANDLGNLCNRSVNMVTRYLGGVVPAASETATDIADLAAEVVSDYAAALAEFRFNGALEAVARLVQRMNRYIEDRAPWKLAKQKDRAALSTVLYTCLEAVRLSAVLLRPVMPTASARLLAQVGAPVEEHEPTWDADARWGSLVSGGRLPAPEPIFPRLPDLKESTKVTEANAVPPKASASVEASAAAETPSITIDDFLKIDLRVGNVVAAEAVPNATKLLKLTVEIAGEERTVLAGIAEMYEPDELVGKQVIVVANLQPRKMRGVMSQGMLLAADIEGQAILLQPETKVPSGARVR